MNREEESSILANIDRRVCDDELSEALDMAIEALEQEPILDEIRAEIEQNAYPIVYGFNNREKGMTLYGILRVIDKYKE